ncbi:DUF3297 family protein [Rheinheimera maricola]|uniref:DUF3297 family protein n=1 Tax=Rheinheimera maricola TaxID=2793282 RepID=A0ABS7XAF2_9GAMM|nr:DUF3297 family protein [Rheinheimera maricola]MBZ9611597.1 DUF3297 family protein [Rheinheimera maricola]
MNDTITNNAVSNDATARPALPDRLSVNPRSPHYVKEIFQHDVGITLNGKDRFDVEEYCISEGWVKVAAAKALDRRGQPLLMTLKGTVAASYR